MKQLPSQQYLQSRIDYNPETGEARWKPVDSSYGPNWKTFNSKFANQLLPDNKCTIQYRVSTARVLYKLFHGVEPPGPIQFLDKDATNKRISNLGSTVQIKKDTFVANTLTLPDEVKDLLIYEHKTGILNWKQRDDNGFNTKYANKPAGYLDKSGYTFIKILGTKYRAHRLAWLLYYNSDPKDYFIDHIDGNRSNNSIKNLRLATHSFNIQMSTNPLGYTYSNGKYAASSYINGVKKHLGTFDTEAEARIAYENALQKYKPIYSFTSEEQSILDDLYKHYPNVCPELQAKAHNLQVRALNHYIDASNNC